MHYRNLFNKTHINSQEIFNKKINWYFDIKNILFENISKKRLLINTKQIITEYSSLKPKKNISYKKTYLRNKFLIKKNFLKEKDSLFKNNVLSSLNYLKKNCIEEYFDNLLIQGSLATNDYIIGWSDFDSIGVLKDDVLKNEKKILELRKILKNFYKKIVKFSPFQHHGIIIFTNYDLKYYLPGYLPLEAIKEKCISVIKNTNLNLNRIINNNKINLSKKILLGRKYYLEEGIKNKYYDHHIFNNKKLSLPLKENEETLKQLFVHIGFMLNIPVLFLDAIGESSHKKKSFNKFYKNIEDTKVINFIKKHENLRKNFLIYFRAKSKINIEIIDYLGKDYFKECLKVVNYCLKNI